MKPTSVLPKVEKSLKRFLKRKVACTASLLTAFLITGSLALANATELDLLLAGSRETLLASLKDMREALESSLKANQRSLKSFEDTYTDLVREADWYSKPRYPSTQVLLDYQYVQGGKSKDITSKVFGKDIMTVAEHYAVAGVAGVAIAAAPTPSQLAESQSRIIAGNGVVVDGGMFRETVEVDTAVVGVDSNDIVLTPPTLTAVTPNVPVSGGVASVNLSAIPDSVSVNVPNVGTPTLPASVSIVTPATPSVSVAAPSSVEKISLTSPAMGGIIAPSDKTVSVQAPDTPKGYESARGYQSSVTVTPGELADPTIATPTFNTWTVWKKMDGPTGYLLFYGLSAYPSYTGTPAVAPDTEATLRAFLMKNYDTYEPETPGATLSISLGNGTETYPVTWSGTRIKGTVVANEAYPTHTTGTYYLENGLRAKQARHIFEDCLDHNVTITGNYEITLANSNLTNNFFFSHSSQNVGSATHGNNVAGERKIVFDGKLTLHGNVSGNTRELSGFNSMIANSGDRHEGAISIFENRGEIILEEGKYLNGLVIEAGEGNIVRTNDQVKNTGKIIINSQWSTGVYFGYYNVAKAYKFQVDVSIGNIEINGEHNIGLILDEQYTGSTSIYGNTHYDYVTITSGKDKDGNPTKITVGGTNNVGVYLTKARTKITNPIAMMSDINIEVNGENNVGFLRHSTEGDYFNYGRTTNQNDMILDDTTMGTFTFGPDAKNSVLIRTDIFGIQINKDITVTQGGTGNMFAQAIYGDTAGALNNLRARKITVGQDVTLTSTLSHFTGIYVLAVHTAEAFNYGTIRITGSGSNNIGMAAVRDSGSTTSNYAGIWNYGTIEVDSAGGNNIGIYNLGRSLISGTIKVSGESSVALYSKTQTGFTKNEQGYSHLSNVDGVSPDIQVSNGAIGIYADACWVAQVDNPIVKITVDDTSNPTIRGMAAYATNGGIIRLMNAQIEVKEGAAGVASVDNASSIVDLTGATLKYSGEGYAVYTDGLGQIDLTNANVILGGKAVGVALTNISNVTLSNTTFTMMSNDATVAILKNITGLKASNLKTSLTSKLTNLTIVDGVGDDGTVYDGYKIAAMDGGAIDIDANLDKADNNVSSPGYIYYRRFSGQRMVVNVGAGIEVKAQLDSNTANSYYRGQVVGLEMSSSTAATALANTQINLAAGSKVIADRTDAGDGAIGLYINYGTVNIASGASVDVEQDTTNVVNNSAVGVYAVNGSQVTNAGDINVGGDQSIGVIGLAYREDAEGNPVVDEFGTTVTGQGKATIINNNNITLDGIGTIGIYAYNNNPSGTKTDVTVTNASGATIKVGKSSATASSVGIYGDKATISNQGTISVGDGGVAIYATNGTEVKNLGTLDLGSGGVGVVLDNTSDVSATAMTLTSNAATSTGMTAFMYKGTGAENRTIGAALDTSSLDKVTIISAADLNLTSSGTLKVGKEGVGIVISGDNTNTAYNTGTIDLVAGKTGAVGMYTKSANIENSTGGKIEVRDASQIGMYAEGANTRVSNKGVININVDGATGIFVKSGASTDLASTNNINITGKSSIGVYAENANVNFKDNFTFANNNENKNISVYGKSTTGGSTAITIDTGKTVTVDGMSSPTTAGHKTVGVYLENAGGSGTFSGKLDVKNEAVGIYSKGNNNLTLDVTATGDKTTGVFIEGGSTISGTVTAKGTATAGAVGIYGSGGALNIDTTSGITLNTNSNKGTGMYLTDGAAATGGDIKVHNTAGTKNIGVYYNKGTATTQVTNSANINLTGTNSIGMYLDDGINLANTKAITSTSANDNIATYVAGNSTLTSSGNITMSGQDNLGIYVDKGTAKNTGTIDISNATKSATGSSVALIAKTDAGNIATVENTGDIKAGANLGMYVSGTGTSIGKNSGTIIATSGTGVYIDGANSSFDGTGGKIQADKVGIYLKDTTGGTIKTGAISITSTGGVAVYGDNAKIDINASTTTAGVVGVAAKGNSIITGDITVGVDGIGAFLLDSGVTFNGTTITTGAKATGTSVGILLDNTTPSTYTIDNVTVNAKDGVGIYMNGNNLNLGNSSVITEGGIGVYANNGKTLTTTGTTTVNIKNGGTGIYIDNATANLSNGASDVLTMNITGTGGVGVYATGISTTANIQNTTINLAGTDGVGAYLKGNVASFGLASDNITSTTAGNTGLLLDGTSVKNLNIGNISLGNESVGVLATDSGTSTITGGSISVGDGSSTRSAIGLVAQKGANVSISGTTINTGKGGIGIYAATGTTVNVANASDITVGADGVYMYSKGANLTFAGNIAANNGIGIFAEGGTLNTSGTSAITVTNGGVGIYAKGAAPNLTGLTVNVQAGTVSKYSMGIYYNNVPGTINIPTISQSGSYTIGTVLDKVSGAANSVSLGSATENNQVGVMAKNGSNVQVNGAIIINGDNNTGIFGENSVIKAVGAVTVGDSTPSADKSTSSIGISLDGGSYEGNDAISVGDYSIGVHAKGLTSTSEVKQVATGKTMTVGDGAIGIYGEGTGGKIELTMDTIGVGSNNAIGVFAKGVDTDVAGDMTVGTDSSVGIFSQGNGNVTYDGDLTVANKATSSSIGIYKSNGTGTITTSNSTGTDWNIGDGSYGIFIDQTTGKSAALNNSVNMNLGTASIGIYSNGANTVTNTGDITVGATDVHGDHDATENHENSVGMYLSGGTTATNSGTITVNHDHSVGVYGDGTSTSFTNDIGGNINVDNGGIGILMRNGAVAINNGTITIGSTEAACGATTVGMSASKGAKIINNKDITVNQGFGMLLGVGGTFENNGTITVNNGIGIQGHGAVKNHGKIVVNGGQGFKAGTGALKTEVVNAKVGAVVIETDGTIKVNGNYVSIGGTLAAAGAIEVNGAYVDVTTGTPLFEAKSVSGEVKILPNFASTGNGYSYEITNFVITAIGTISGSKLTPVTSPLFVAKVTEEESLVIAKRPYADLVVGTQFDALHAGLDSVLEKYEGIGKDVEMLKNLNTYLEGFSGSEFEAEAAVKLAETRGDMYSTIQDRMQTVNNAFDHSFHELESSFNSTKDNDKFSVIMSSGKYSDLTLGIDDYDYTVQGVLYMKEKEGIGFGDKHGYTLGLAGSRFEFDDGGSKEDVYSVRAGAHAVKSITSDNSFSWLTRGEVGYNRHMAERRLDLGQTYTNEGNYNTYSVSLDNRFTKTVYTDFSRHLDVYVDAELEYGRLDGFSEKGGLELELKDNEYFSALAGVGVKAEQKIYLGKKTSVKVGADVKYAYELGDNYKANEARVKDGTEGYYSLITPEAKEGKLSGKVGLTVERSNRMSLTLEAEVVNESHKDEATFKYGARFNYRF